MSPVVAEESKRATTGLGWSLKLLLGPLVGLLYRLTMLIGNWFRSSYYRAETR